MRKAVLLFFVGSLACAQQTVPPSQTPYVNFTQGFQLNGSFGSASSCPISTGNGTVWGSCGIGIPGLQTDGNNGTITGGNAIFKGSTPRFDLDSYSAAGNATKFTGCGITSGTKILTCTSATFNCGTMVGWAGFVVGAGGSSPNGKAEVSTIASCQSTTQVTLADNASNTVSGQVAYFGSNDKTPLANCVAAATAAGGECHANDAKMYMISDTTSTIHVTGAAKGSGVASDGHGTFIFAPYGTLTPGNNDRMWNISSSITQYFGSMGGILKGATSFAVTTAPALTQGQWLQVAEVSYPGGYGYFDWARVASSVANDNLAGGTYTSGISATGAAGSSCIFTTFNNGLGSAQATIYLTGTNAIASGTPFYVNTPSTGSNGTPPTSAVASNGTATCSGTVVVSTTLGTTINTVQPFRMAIPDSAPKWTGNLTLTQVSRVGSLVTYTYSSLTGQRPWPGSMITISGFVNSGNNGTMKVLTVAGGTSGTFTTTTNSPLQVNETHAGTGVDVDTQFGAGNQGQIYFAVNNGNLIENFYLRNFKVIAPVLGVGLPMIFNYQAVLNPQIQNTTVDAPSAQGLEWFLNKDGWITDNRWNTYGEIPSSVGPIITRNDFNAAAGELTSFLNACTGHGTTTSMDLDLGLGWFTFTNNKISNWCSPAIAMYQGDHDGVVEGNEISYANANSSSAIGIVVIGGYNNHITHNTLGGAVGGSTTGIITEDSNLYGIQSQQNIVRDNIIATGGFATRIACSGALGTDAVYDTDDTGTETQECGGGGQVGTVTIGPATGTAPLNGLNYRGNTTSGMQLVFGSNQAGGSFSSTMGTQYSSGAVFLAHNAMQTTTNTDQWTQPLTSSRSTFLSVDALFGLRYCLNNSGAANAAFLTFFPSCPITFTPNGHSYIESQGTGAVNLNVRSGAGTGGVAGGNGSGSSTWTISGAGAAAFLSGAFTNGLTAASETSTGTNQSADAIVTSLGNSTQPPCPNGTSNKLTLTGCTFPISLQLFSTVQVSPTAGATYYTGQGGAAINGSLSSQVPWFLPRAGTLTFCALGIQVAGTKDTGANNITLSITDSNNTNFNDTNTTVTAQNNQASASVTASDAIAAGHKLILKAIMPASWTTQPTLVTFSANCILQ